MQVSGLFPILKNQCSQMTSVRKLPSDKARARGLSGERAVQLQDPGKVIPVHGACECVGRGACWAERVLSFYVFGCFLL